PAARDLMRFMRALPPGVAEHPTTVGDPVGLGRFLQKLRSEYFPRRTPDEMTTVAQELRAQGYLALECDIAHLEEGRGDLKKEDLLELGKLYKVQPMLFYNFLFPPVPGFVVLRPSEAERQHGVSDFEEVTNDFVREAGPKYLVPRRNLALSDITI